MARFVSDETKMNKGHQRIDKVFNWAQNEKFSVNAAKKNGLSEMTYEGYREKVHALYNKYAEQFGTTEIWKIDTGKMMNLIKSEYGNNAFSIKGYAHAANFFSKASGISGTFKEPVNLVDMKAMTAHFKEEGVIRKAGDSTVLKATHMQCEDVLKKIGESRSPYKQQAALAIECGRRFGSRVDGALGLRGRDITLNADGTATVKLTEKGGLPRWVHITDKEDVQFAENLKNSVKNENHTVIPPLVNQSGNSKGKYMNHSDSAERLAKVVSGAAKKCGLSDPKNKSEAAFSIHSARKTFCQTQVDRYAEKTVGELKKELESRILQQEKLQEKLEKEKPGYKITSFREKYKTALSRVNYNSDGSRRTKKDRDLNHKELALLLTSFDTGHFRTDVMRFYAEYPMPEK